MANIPVNIVIDKDGDLTLNFYQRLRRGDDTESFIGATGKIVQGTVVASMKVNRQVLINNSQPFKSEFSGSRYLEKNASTVDMEVDTVKSVEIVMRVIHDALTDDLYTVEIPELWEVIQYCDYRAIDVSKMNDWFKGWMEKKKSTEKIEPEEMVQLLFPCYKFDHAQGFGYLTKTLAYESADHITEHNPTNYRHLHLDGNVIGALNGARGSLRSKLLRGLFDPVGEFLKKSCSCKEKSLFAYNIGLSKTGIWPLHEHYKKSVQEILDSSGFKDWKVAIPEGACMTCRSRLTSTEVKKTHAKISNDFHGHCLDCMTMSKDVDQDYWDHDLHKEWDVDCRINHSQPSWYFSFMGRKTDMTNHKAMKKANYERNKAGYKERLGMFGF